MLLHYHWHPKLSDALGLSYAELGAPIERQTDRRLSWWQRDDCVMATFYDIVQAKEAP